MNTGFWKSGRVAARCIGRIFLMLLLLAASQPAAAQSFKLRYVNTTGGALTFCGNTLGLAKLTGVNQPGSLDAIGAFITLNTNSQVGNYPPGTTLNWSNNSSATVLRYPANSTVLYAELIWAGSAQIGNSVTAAGNVLTNLDTPVQFILPDGSTNSVAPDPLTANLVTNGSSAIFYVCSADVTTLVQSAGTGTYSLGGVPAAMLPTEDANNACGWTLAVVYGNSSLHQRNLSLFVGNSFAIASGSAPNPAAVTGFCAPPTGAVNGRLFVSAMEGDPNKTGDQMRFGPTTNTLVSLSGTNNLLNNFFAGQINDDNGILDTSGTFGLSNSTTAAVGFSARQGWDITSVDVSSGLNNGLTTAYAQNITAGDGYTVNALGLQIDVGSPVLGTTQTVDKASTFVGDVLTYTVTITNSGTADAVNLLFTDPLPFGTSFVNNTFATNGTIIAVANPVTGVPVPIIQQNSSITFTYQVQVNQIPPPAKFVTAATIIFQYSGACAQSPIINGTLVNADVQTLVPLLNVSKASSLTNAIPGANLTYTINVPNIGTTNTTGTSLIDPLPAGVLYVTNTTTLNGIPIADVNGTNMPYSVVTEIHGPGRPAGQINVGEAAVITYQVKISPAPPTRINNTATIFANGTNAMSAQSAAVNILPVYSDLAVGIIGNPNPVSAGAPISYTVTVTNRGPDSINLITNFITLYLPLSSSILSPIYTPGSGSYNPLNGIWSGITLASNGVITLNISGTVSPNAPSSIVSSITATPPPGIIDLVTNNNTASVTNAVVQVADLAVTISDGVTNVYGGGALTYTITAINHGPSTLNSIEISNSFSSFLTNLTFAPSEGDFNSANGIWSGVALASGDSVILTVQATVRTNASGAFTNSTTVSVPSGVTDPILTNNFASDVDVIQTTPDIAVTGSGPANVLAGGTIIYTVTLTNLSPLTASNVVVNDDLPSGVMFVSATGGGTNNSGIVTWPTVNVLTNGQAFVFFVTVTAPVAGTLTNVVSGITSTVDPVPGNNDGTDPSAITITIVTPVADLAIGKSGPAGSFLGASFSYTISITNFGPSTANSLSVTDNLPANLSFVSSLPATTRVTGNQVVWTNLNNLAVGSVTNLTLTVTATARGTFTNLASAGSPTLDPATTNNISAPAITAVTNRPPVALNDSTSTPENVLVTIPVLVNDSDPDGDALAIVSIAPTNGTANIVGTNIVFLPTTNFIGTAIIGYLITDGFGGNSSALVTVTVTNRPPLANPDDYVIGENSGTNILSPLTNDIVRTSGGSLTIIAVNPTNGTASISGTNVLFAPATNFLGVATIGYTIIDNVGGTNFGLITITVTNLPPLANPDAYTVLENSTNTFSPLTNDVLRTPGGTLILVNVSPTNGTAVISGTNIIFTPTNNFIGTALIGYTITDGIGGTNNSLITVTVLAVADVSVSKAGPPTVSAATNFSYTITVTNLGPGSAANLSATDSLPAAVSFVSASAGGTISGSLLVWTNLGSLAAGAFTNLSVTVTAPVSAISLTNVASAGSPTADPNFTNNLSPPVVTTVMPMANLIIGKTGPATVFAASNLTYTISVTNFGPSSAVSVVVTDTLPASVTFVSASSGGATNAGAVNWNFGTLISGQVSNVTVTVIAPAGGSLTNTANVSSPTGDPIPTNNLTPPVITSVTPVADLGIGKIGPASVFAASNLTYTISITNFGPSSAGSVVITDSLPAGVTFVSASGGGSTNAGVVNWNLGTLISSQVSNVTVTVTAPTSGSLTNTANVSSPTGDLSPTNNLTPPVITSVTPLADVRVSKSGPAGIIFGTNYNYTITVTNAGPSTAASLSVTDSLPAGLEFISSIPTTTTNASNQVIWSNLGNLTAGASTNLLLTVISTARGSLTNFASAGSPTGDPVPTNNLTPPVVTLVTNYPPLGSPDFYSMAENTTNILSPLTNDIVRTPGGTLTIINVSPTNGVASISGTNVIFIPTPNFVGVATIGYTIIDNVGGTNSSLISVTVTNQSPLAFAQSVTTTENTPLPVTLTGSDPVNRPLTFIIASAPTNGTLTLLNTNTGTVTYTPSNNYAGPDAFVFRVNNGINNSSNATITISVTPVADLQVTQSGPLNGVAGSNLTYTVTVTNLGPSGATNIIVTNQIGAGFTFVSASAAGVSSNGFVLWTIPILPMNGSTNLTATVLAIEGGTFTNIASGISDPLDLNATNNNGSFTNAQVVTAVSALADVAVFKSGTTNILAGGTVNYSVTATNSGPSTAANVFVQDALPANAIFQGASGNYSISNNIILWTSVDLPGGTATNFTVSVTAPSSGALTNVASSTSTTPDSNTNNNNGSSSNSIVHTTVTPVADLAIGKSGPATIFAGTNFIYTISITNLGPSLATTFSVTDSLPAGLVFVSASPVTTTNLANQVIWNNLSNLAAGASSNLTITVKSVARGMVTNLATVGGPVLDNSPTNNVSAPVITTITNRPPVALNDTTNTLKNVAVTVAVLNNDSDPDGDGSSIVGLSPTNGTANIAGTNVIFTPTANFSGTGFVLYTISDGNGGTNSALITILVSNRPPAANGQSVTTTFNTPKAITLTGSDPDNDALTFIIVGAPTNGALSLINTNSGAATYTPGNNYVGSDAFTFRVNDGTSNSAVATVNISVTAPVVADLAVFKSGPANGVAGSNLVYSITVTNLGPSSATNVLVKDQLPPGFTFVSATPTNVTVTSNLVNWAAFNLVAHGKTNFTITAFSSEGGTFTNIASATSDAFDTNAVNNNGTSTNSQTRTIVTARADVAVFKNGATNAIAGGIVSYTIIATNFGPSTATNVVIKDNLPVGSTLSSATPGYAISNNVVTWPNIVLTNGASVNYSIAIIAPASSSFTNIALSTSDTLDPNPTNNSGTATNSRVTTKVTPAADVIVLVFGPTNVIKGSNFVYNIVVTNAGPSGASNVVTSDSLPTNLVFVSASAGGLNTNNVITWPKVLFIPFGGVTNYSLVVNAPLTGVFTNIASATATTFDPDPTNNTGVLPASQVLTTVTPVQFDWIAGQPLFNPQTGLYEESVTVTNISSNTVAGLRLYVIGLPNGVSLWNATGTNGGLPYIQHNFPLDPGSSVGFVLEFYDPSRISFSNTLSVVAIIPPNNTNGVSTNGAMGITKIFTDVRTNGTRFVIEFNTVPGKTYTILYSADVSLPVWKVGTPSVTANANITQWYDDGPPKTESKPTSVNSRFYRVIQN